jgi:putative spermidine/putrescine transport system permease protein
MKEPTVAISHPSPGINWRRLGVRVLGLWTALYLTVLYVPFLIMAVLSFTGPNGGPTFPMQGVSLYWYGRLFNLTSPGSLGEGYTADIGAQTSGIGQALLVSLCLAVMTAAASTVLGTLAALAFRRPFRGSGAVFYLFLLGIMTPGLMVGLGIMLFAGVIGIDLNWYATTWAAHIVWTMPFSFIIMLMMFNRFDHTIEEAARTLRADEWQTFRHVTLPLIMPGLLSSVLFGFTLSFDEFVRSFFATGPQRTLPLIVLGSLTARITPVLYALGSLTTVFSLLLIAAYVLAIAAVTRRTRLGRTPPRG